MNQHRSRNIGVIVCPQFINACPHVSPFQSLFAIIFACLVPLIPYLPLPCLPYLLYLPCLFAVHSIFIRSSLT